MSTSSPSPPLHQDAAPAICGGTSMQPSSSRVSNLEKLSTSLSTIPLSSTHVNSYISNHRSSGKSKEATRQTNKGFEVDEVTLVSEFENNTNTHRLDSHGATKVPELQEIQSMLSAQHTLMHQQIEELQRVLIFQLKLTGVNPISQEMMATMLGTKAGRRPEDSITKEAFRCLQDFFSIKDTITKKEACDISVRSGATRTQVRDFFAGQQSRVRKLLQQSNDEVGHLVSQSEQPETVANKNITSHTGTCIVLSSDTWEHLLDQMQSESTFSGQADLLHSLLQTSQASFLRLFLDKGGLRVLRRWLLKAAMEEQTTLLRLLLKVLSHLPVTHAVPGQMSSIVQAVNKLRIYGSPDIASRARTLLAKWSKLFGKTASGKSNVSSFDTVPLQEKPGAGDLEASPSLAKRSREQQFSKTEFNIENKRVKIEKVFQSDFKDVPTSPLQTCLDRCQTHATSDVSKELLSSSATAQKDPETSVDLSTGSAPQEPDTLKEPSRKRLVTAHGKERRKVLLVDELVGFSRRGKDVDVRRTVVVDKFSRPLSADDIPKAKMRARILQNSISRKDITKAPEVQSHRSEDFNVLQADGTGLRSAALEPTRIENFFAVPSILEIPAKKVLINDQECQNSSDSKDGVSSCTALKDALQQEGTTVRTSFLLKFPTDGEVNPEAQNVAENSASSLSPMSSLGCKTYFQQGNAVGVLEHDAIMICNLKPKDIFEDANEQNDLLIVHNNQNRALSCVDKDTLGFDYEVSKAAEMDISRPQGQMSDQISARAKFLAGKTIWLPWSLPPEVYLDPHWSIAAGEDSKEKGIQFDRVSREEEAFYLDSECIPENPKAPWDEEPEYDDSLTSEIPSDVCAVEESQQAAISAKYNPVIDESPSMNIEDISTPIIMEKSPPVPTVFKSQAVPEIFAAVNPQRSKPNQVNYQGAGTPDVISVAPQVTSALLMTSSSALVTTASQSTSQLNVTNTNVINHDPELLAFLLRNPEVLSQLTSQRGSTQGGPPLRIPPSYESNLDKSCALEATSSVRTTVTNVTPSLVPGSTTGLLESAGFSDRTNATIVSLQSKAMVSRAFQPQLLQAQCATSSLLKSARFSWQAAPLVTSGSAATSMHVPFNSNRKISVEIPSQGVSDWKLGGTNVTMCPSTATLAQQSATPTNGLLRWPNSAGMIQTRVPGSSRQSSVSPEDNATPASRQLQFTGHTPPLPAESRIVALKSGHEEAPREGSTPMPHRAFTGVQQEKFVGGSHLPNLTQSVHVNSAQDHANPMFRNTTPTYFTGSVWPTSDRELVRRTEHPQVATQVSNSSANVPIWMPNVGSSRPAHPSEVIFASKQHPVIPHAANSFSRPILTASIPNVVLPREGPTNQFKFSNNPPRSTWRG